MKNVQVWANGKLVDTFDFESDPAQDNADAIDGLMVQAMNAMQNIIDTPDVAFANVAAAQTAMRQLQQQVRQEAQLLKRVIRKLRNDYSGTA